MKTAITYIELAEMTILSTYIADCIMTELDVKFRTKKARNNSLEASKDIITRLMGGFAELYDKSDSFYDKYSELHSEPELIFICRGVLKSYLNIYDFNDKYYNLFKKVWKNSDPFEAKNFDIPEKEKISFIKDLKSITQKKTFRYEKD